MFDFAAIKYIEKQVTSSRESSVQFVDYVKDFVIINQFQFIEMSDPVIY